MDNILGTDEREPANAMDAEPMPDENGELPRPNPPYNPQYEAILQFVRQCFWKAEQSRRMAGVEERMVNAKLRRAGKYDPNQLATIKKQKQPSVFLRHTTTKCNHAEAIFAEIESTVSSRSWSIDPTPIPDVPDDLRERVVQESLSDLTLALQTGELQGIDRPTVEALIEKRLDQYQTATLREAKRRCARAERKIRDHFEKFKWDRVYSDVRSDGVTCGTGVLKGPVVRKLKQLTWQGTQPVVAETPLPLGERVDPIMFYYQPGISTVDEGWVIEKSRISRASLDSLIGTKDEDGNAIYIDEAIRAILLEATSRVDDTPADYQRCVAERKDQNTSRDEHFDLYEFWGTVPGRMLKAAGMDVKDESREYPYQVMWCANRVIKVPMPNPDPLGRKPYWVWHYKRNPGAPWGDGVPDLMADKQDFINAAGRALAVRMGLAMGPQVEVDMTRKVDGGNYTDIWPCKIWPSKNPGMLTAPAIRFQEIDPKVQDFLTVKREFEKDSDDATGVQAFTYGNQQVAGAGRTAAGMAQLVQLAMRGIKQTIAQLDEMKSGFISALYQWFVMYTDDPDFRGDAQVVTRGTLGIMLSDLRLQRLKEAVEMCRVDQNFMQVIGPAGYTKLLREYIELLLPTGSEIVPSDTDVLREIDEHARQLEMIAKSREQAAEQMQMGGGAVQEQAAAGQEGQPAAANQQQAQQEQPQPPQGAAQVAAG